MGEARAVHQSVALFVALSSRHESNDNHEIGMTLSTLMNTGHEAPCGMGLGKGEIAAFHLTSHTAPYA